MLVSDNRHACGGTPTFPPTGDEPLAEIRWLRAENRRLIGQRDDGQMREARLQQQVEDYKETVAEFERVQNYHPEAAHTHNVEVENDSLRSQLAAVKELIEKWRREACRMSVSMCADQLSRALDEEGGEE
jgi:hypothetical protein